MAAWRSFALVLFHVVFTAVHCAQLGTGTSVSMKAHTKADGFMEMFNPPTMLILSSPMERKVSYTQLENFKAKGGVVLPLLDAGLIGPYGLAWDAPRSALYICDAALRKIIRVKIQAVKCLRQCKGLSHHLRIEGNIYTVVEDVVSQWASVDSNGNLFFTDQDTNSVSKLKVEYIEKIITDQIMAKDLKKTSQSEVEGEEAVKESTEDDEKPAGPTVKPIPAPPSILRLYEKDVSPNVGTPAGVVAAGAELFWTNQAGGLLSGTVVNGKTEPRIKKTPEIEPAAEPAAVAKTGESPALVQTSGGADGDAAAAADGEATAVAAAEGESSNAKPCFPSKKMATEYSSAYGIDLTASKIVYTLPSHSVVATSRGTGETVKLSNGLLKPRGIVWDGDNTVYVADQEGNYIVSMPIGLLKANAPVSHALDIHAPFGLALVRSTDPIWEPFKPDWSKQKSGAHGVGLACSSVIVLVIGAIATSLRL